MKDLNDEVKECSYKEGTLLLANMAGFEWQMFINGEVLSSFPKWASKDKQMIAIHNNDAVNDPEMRKKIVVAVIKANIHNSIETATELMKKAGFNDFEIDYDYVHEKLKFGELD